MAAVLYTAVWLANAFLPDATGILPHPGPGDDPPPVPLEALFGGWVHWDAGWYVSIAESGYYYVRDGQSPIAFFPAYPLTIRTVEPLFGSASLAGIGVTFLCGFAAAMLWWRWLVDHVVGEARRLAFLVLVFWPYAWYLYGAVYADALFLAATLAAFVLLDRDRPVLAGIAGAVATAARPVGLAVSIGLVAVLLHRRLTVPAQDRTGDDVQRGARGATSDGLRGRGTPETSPVRSRRAGFVGRAGLMVPVAVGRVRRPLRVPCRAGAMGSGRWPIDVAEVRLLRVPVRRAAARRRARPARHRNRRLPVRRTGGVAPLRLGLRVVHASRWWPSRPSGAVRSRA